MSKNDPTVDVRKTRLQQRDIATGLEEHTVKVPWWQWPDIQRITAQMRQSARNPAPLTVRDKVCYIGKKPLKMNGQTVCKTLDWGIVTKVYPAHAIPKGKLWVELPGRRLVPGAVIETLARMWRRI